jgi:hypothetical protein
VVRSIVRADGRHDVGVVFLPLPPGVRDLLTREVRGLLLALGLQLGQLYQGAGSCRTERISEGPAAPS